MRLRYSFRIYPTPRQQVPLAQAFGCARRLAEKAHRYGRTFGKVAALG
ncbi:helix-turn-helix domain-containing protein [Nocardia rhizosphaerae]|uniref:Helix-turn-helix domain-containing protein n=1 Tax=Nocardia rhizosphaerae TaxID=1691571 RepID=A0ABV8KYG6_9NOCA